MSGGKMSWSSFETEPSRRQPSEEEVERRKYLRGAINEIKLYGTTSDDEIKEMRAKIKYRANWSPGGMGSMAIGKRGIG